MKKFLTSALDTSVQKAMAPIIEYGKQASSEHTEVSAQTIKFFKQRARQENILFVMQAVAVTLIIATVIIITIHRLRYE